VSWLFLAARIATRRIVRAPAMTAVTIAAVALATAALLTVLSVEHAAESRGQRETQRHFDTDEGSPVPGSASIAVTTFTLDGHEVTIIEIGARDEDAPLPVGLERYPQPGEVFVSDAMLEVSRTYPSLFGEGTELLPGQIADEGLVHPGEMIAYRGWTARDLEERAAVAHVSSFSSRGAVHEWWRSKVAVRLGLALLVAGIVLPALAVVGVLARVSAARRRDLAAGLRLAGADRGFVAMIVAGEAVFSATVGVALGAAGFASARQILAQVEIGGYPWFASDFWPGVGTIAFTVAAVPLLAGIAAVAGARHAIASPLVAARRGRVAPPRTRLVFAGYGAVACLAVAAGLAGAGAPVFVPFAVTGVVVGIVLLPFAGPVLLGSIAHVLGARTRRPTVLLAARSIGADPSGAFRPAAGVAVTVVLVVMINGYASGNLESGAVDWYSGAADIVVERPSRLEADISAFADSVGSAAPHTEILVVRQGIDRGEDLVVVAAECAVVMRWHLASVSQCADGIHLSEYAVARELTSITVGEWTVEVPPGLESILIESTGGCCIGADILIEPDMVPPQFREEFPVQRILLSTSNTTEASAVRVAAARALPGSTSITQADLLAESNRAVRDAARLVNMVAFVGIVLAAVALAASSAGRALERALSFVRLRSAGAEFHTLLGAQSLESAIVLGVALTLGIGAGLATSNALVTALGGVFSPSLLLAAGLVAGAASVVAAVTALISDPLARATAPGRLRDT